jgi:hypothetical protein
MDMVAGSVRSGCQENSLNTLGNRLTNNDLNVVSTLTFVYNLKVKAAKGEYESAIATAFERADREWASRGNL